MVSFKILAYFSRDLDLEYRCSWIDMTVQWTSLELRCSYFSIYQYEAKLTGHATEIDYHVRIMVQSFQEHVCSGLRVLHHTKEHRVTVDRALWGFTGQMDLSASKLGWGIGL
jgi:hypothetical protein